MAKKPAAATAAATLAPTMDYAEHEATYEGFMAALKWSIISMIFIVLSLYCFIQAQQPLLGVALLALPAVAAIVAAVTRTRRS